jgi:hypothetical protein
MHSLSLELRDEAETIALGQRLASTFREKQALILLSGPLGAGKTTLAQAFINTLAKKPESVLSPTFSYVKSYEANPPILHFDLYRISSPLELRDLGLLEDLYDESKLRLVEWPERFPSLKNSASLQISLTPSSAGRSANLVYFEHSGMLT